MKAGWLGLTCVTVLVISFGVITTRSRIIETGRTINKLQKELSQLRDVNSKLKNRYRRLATPENIFTKNQELNLSLVPPREVIRVRAPEEEAPVVRMKKPATPDGDGSNEL